MHSVKKMIDKLEKELEKYADKGELTAQEWDVVFKATDALKDMKTICAMDEYGDEEEYDYEDREGTSGRNRMGRQRYYRDNSYGNGSNRGMNGYSGNSYGTANSGSFMRKAQELMDYAENDEQRRMAQNMLSSMNNRY